MVSVIQIIAAEGILLDDVDSNACLIMTPSSFGSSSVGLWLLLLFASLFFFLQRVSFLNRENTASVFI